MPNLATGDGHRYIRLLLLVNMLTKSREIAAIFDGISRIRQAGDHNKDMPKCLRTLVTLI